MGQKIGKPRPICRQELVDERWRVLRQSSEVLARADEYVNTEESFLLDKAEYKLAGKIKKWLDVERSRIIAAAAVYGWNDRLDYVEKALAELGDEMNRKMRKDYEAAYDELNRFARLIDNLAEKQRKIHKKILDLEELGPREGKKFHKKLSRLRIKVFKNLNTSEKMAHHDKKLRKQFVKKVYDIDRDNKEFCKKKVEHIIKDFYTIVIH